MSKIHDQRFAVLLAMGDVGTAHDLRQVRSQHFKFHIDTMTDPNCITTTKTTMLSYSIMRNDNDMASA